MNDDCIRTRGVLYPLDEPKPSSRRVDAARRHLATCPSCVEFFDAERGFTNWLRGKIDLEVTPPSLRERIIRHAAAARNAVVPRPRPILVALVAVAAVAAVAAFSLRVFDGSGSGIREVELALVEDHIRYLSSEARLELESSDVREVAAWFHEKLHFPVRAPSLTDGELLGARRCFLLGSRVALLFYEVEERPLSLFILDGETVDLSEARFETVGNKAFCHSSRSGYHLVLWREAGLVFAMVSALPSDSLIRLAESL